MEEIKNRSCPDLMQLTESIYDFVVEEYEQQCYLEIVEQPVSSYRFRYESEMKDTHGCLTGCNSTKTKKTYPTVKLKGYHGTALIVCSLYQIDNVTPHLNNLMYQYKRKTQIGKSIAIEVGPFTDYCAVFEGINIIFIQKKHIPDMLFQEKKQSLESNQKLKLLKKDIIELRRQCRKETQEINLDKVVLQFQAFEKDTSIPLGDPVYSNPISHSQSVSAGLLIINRISSPSGCAGGGDELFLFVEKVVRNNIKVRFFELIDDQEVWSDFGVFNESNVHHQYAIAVKIPPYKDKNILCDVKVFIELVRKSDNARSKPIEFIYKPRDYILATNLEYVLHVKKKYFSKFQSRTIKMKSENDLGDMPKLIQENPENTSKFENDLKDIPKIICMSPHSGSVIGGDELFLTVKNVEKNNIKVKFFQMDESMTTWSEYGTIDRTLFKTPYTLTVRTPPYIKSDISSSVSVHIQLERPSDGAKSVPVDFKYEPLSYKPPKKRICLAEHKSSDSKSKSEFSLRNMDEKEKEFMKVIVNHISKNPAVMEEFVKQMNNEFIKQNSERYELSENLMEIDNSEAELCQQIKNQKLIGSEINENLESRILEFINKLGKSEVIKKIFMQMIDMNIGPLSSSWKKEFLKNLLYEIIRERDSGQGIELLVKIHELKLYDVVDLTNENRDSCLHIAAYNNSFMFVQPLLSIGADPNLQNFNGKTPLHIAVEEGYDECVKYFVDEKSKTYGGIPLKIDIKNDNGETALHIAVRRKNLKIIKLLIENGKASTDICCSKNGNNILHIAVESESLDVIKYIVENTSIDIFSQNLSGATPFEVATLLDEEIQVKVTEILLKKYSDNTFEELDPDTIQKQKISVKIGSVDLLKSLQHMQDLGLRYGVYMKGKIFFDGQLIKQLTNMLENENCKKIIQDLNLQQNLKLSKILDFKIACIKLTNEILMKYNTDTLIHLLEAVKFIRI